MTRRITKQVEEYLWNRELSCFEQRLLHDFLLFQKKHAQLSAKQWNLIKLWMKYSEREDIKKEYK